jgi:uncharacterized coiled-coil DUF342 family protein
MEEVMDQQPEPESRQRILDQVGGAAELLDLIPRLLDENAQLRARAEAAEVEADELRAELDPLRSQLGACRAERDETAESVSKLMADVLDVLNALPARLRPAQRPSPFAREHAGAGNGIENGHRLFGVRATAIR